MAGYWLVVNVCWFLFLHKATSLKGVVIKQRVSPPIFFHQASLASIQVDGEISSESLQNISLRSHPHTPGRYPGNFTNSLCFGISFKLWGFGEVWGPIFPGAHVGKIIEFQNNQQTCGASGLASGAFFVFQTGVFSDSGGPSFFRKKTVP